MGLKGSFGFTPFCISSKAQTAEVPPDGRRGQATHQSLIPEKGGSGIRCDGQAEGEILQRLLTKEICLTREGSRISGGEISSQRGCPPLPFFYSVHAGPVVSEQIPFGKCQTNLLLSIFLTPDLGWVVGCQLKNKPFPELCLVTKNPGRGPQWDVGLAPPHGIHWGYNAAVRASPRIPECF